MGLFNFFKKKVEPNKIISKENKTFEFYGTGRHLKNDEEYQSINKEEADNAFKKYKREILDVYMKEKGFHKYKTNGYVRLNKNRLVEYINIQKEAHGSRTCTLNISLYPLYAPHDFITIGFGKRIGRIINDKDFWWDYKDDITAKLSFENIKNALEQFVIPWFEYYKDEENYIEDLLNRKYQIGFDCIIWTTFLFLKRNDKESARNYLEGIKEFDYFLDSSKQIEPVALNNINKMNEIMEENADIENYLKEVEKANIEKFKLPKSFFK